MPTNCIELFPMYLVNIYLEESNLHCPGQRTSHLGHRSQEPPFCSLWLQSWKPRIPWADLHRVQTSGKHTRKQPARINLTRLTVVVATGSSVTPEDLGTAPNPSGFPLGGLKFVAQGYASSWKDVQIQNHPQGSAYPFLQRSQPFYRLL